VATTRAYTLLVVIWAAALLAGLPAGQAGCQPHEAAVPSELVGVWRTTAPHYADRFLQFTEHGVVFGNEDGRPDPRQIHAIELVREPGRTLYIVSYRNPYEQEYTLAFYYDRADGGVITFKRQQQWQWTKEE